MESLKERFRTADLVFSLGSSLLFGYTSSLQISQNLKKRKHSYWYSGCQGFFHGEAVSPLTIAASLRKKTLSGTPSKLLEKGLNMIDFTDLKGGET